MKIVALTDIHGAYDIAEGIVRDELPDVVIVGGDLTTVGTVKEAEQAVGRLQQCCPRVYCVAGNMDLPQHDELFAKLGVSLNARAAWVGDVAFFGVSAAPYSPLHTPYELSEEEIAMRIHRGWIEAQRARVKIFAPHAPPYGTKLDIIHSGIHVGSMAVREFIEDHQPDAVICGHIHEARGIDSIAATRIVNCGAASRGRYAVIDVGSELFLAIRERGTPHTPSSHSESSTPQV